MELKEYIKIIKKDFKFIIVLSILTGLFTFIFSTLQSAKYETSLSFFINKKETQQTDDFKYDGYYTFQTSDLLADSIEQWVKSPEFVNAVYQKAGINSNFKNLKDYSKRFVGKKMSSQHVEVQFQTQNRQEAEKLSLAIANEINQKMEEMENESAKEISFSVSKKDPLIIENKHDIFLNFVIGLISGLMLGIFVVLGKRYFV